MATMTTTTMKKRTTMTTSSGSAVLDFVMTNAWAMEPGTLRKMVAIVQRHADGQKLSEDEVSQVVATRGRAQRAELSDGFQVLKGGIGVIPVNGVIAKFASQVNGISSPRGTSIEQVRAQLKQALSMDKVKTILLDVDSPGGSASGVPEMADEIRAARSIKPIVAFTDGLMASAAYFLAAQADQVYATKSATVGSIGVYSALVDDSARIHNAGFRVDIVRAGKFKGATEVGQPITSDVRDEVQRQVSAIYELFVEAVAEGRGFDDATARALADGRVHMGAEALELKLIDGIQDLESVLGDIRERVAGSAGSNISAVKAADESEAAMPATKEGAPAVELSAESVAAEHPKVAEQLRGEGAEAAKTEERDRVTSILTASSPDQFELVTKLVTEGATQTEALGALCKDHKERSDERAKVAAEGAKQGNREGALASMREGAPPSMGAGDGQAADGDTGKPKDPESADAMWATMSAEERSQFYDKDGMKAHWEAAEEKDEDPVASVKAWIAGEEEGA